MQGIQCVFYLNNSYVSTPINIIYFYLSSLCNINFLLYFFCFCFCFFLGGVLFCFLMFFFASSIFGAVVIVIAWQLDLHLPVQSVYITAKAMSSNLVNGEVYLIQYYVRKLGIDLRQVGGFLQVHWFPPPIKLTATI